MTSAKKNISDFPLRSPPVDEKNIEILSFPGLSVTSSMLEIPWNLQQLEL